MQIVSDYACAEFFELDERKTRHDFDASVVNHQRSALNVDGVQESGHLATTVKENNGAFLAARPFGYEETDEQYYIMTEEGKINADFTMLSESKRLFFCRACPMAEGTGRLG